MMLPSDQSELSDAIFRREFFERRSVVSKLCKIELKNFQLIPALQKVDLSAFEFFRLGETKSLFDHVIPPRNLFKAVPFIDG
jgi:hypothetical protein